MDGAKTVVVEESGRKFEAIHTRGRIILREKFQQQPTVSDLPAPAGAEGRRAIALPLRLQTCVEPGAGDDGEDREHYMVEDAEGFPICGSWPDALHIPSWAQAACLVEIVNSANGYSPDDESERKRGVDEIARMTLDLAARMWARGHAAGKDGTASSTELVLEHYQECVHATGKKFGVRDDPMMCSCGDPACCGAPHPLDDESDNDPDGDPACEDLKRAPAIERTPEPRKSLVELGWMSQSDADALFACPTCGDVECEGPAAHATGELHDLSSDADPGQGRR